MAKRIEEPQIKTCIAQVATHASDPTHLRLGLVGTCLAMALMSASMATAGIAEAQESQSTPLPPARPSDLAVAPKAAVPALPPAPVTPPGVDPMIANFSPDMPQELPLASRAQMHRCGTEWQKMKESGAATDKTWLAFARVCLTRKE